MERGNDEFSFDRSQGTPLLAYIEGKKGKESSERKSINWRGKDVEEEKTRYFFSINRNIYFTIES